MSIVLTVIAWYQVQLLRGTKGKDISKNQGKLTKSLHYQITKVSMQ